MESVREEIAFLLDQKKSLLAERIVEKQNNLQPECLKKYGLEGRKLSIRDAGYHLPFLAESILADNKAIFQDYVAWVKILFQGLGFPDSAMIKTLECTRDVLNQELTGDAGALASEFIQAGIDQMHQPSVIEDTYIDEKTPLGSLAKKYNTALLNGDRNRASSLIMDAVKGGVEIKDIYLEVFQKSQYEVGRLWLSNQISVAKEHFCSAATQMIMSQLYPYIFSSERIGKKFVGASIGGELHEIGIRMVADFFEMEGWDTYYLGANAPVSTILKAVEENEADVLGLSVAIPYHRNILKSSISDIRKSDLGKDLKILVGGVALKSNFSLEEFNADGYAVNALEAIDKANQLLAG